MSFFESHCRFASIAEYQHRPANKRHPERFLFLVMRARRIKKPENTMLILLLQAITAHIKFLRRVQQIIDIWLFRSFTFAHTSAIFLRRILRIGVLNVPPRR